VLAAGVVIGGSAFLVAAVFDSLSNLQTVQTRTQLREAVTSSAGKDLGITLDQALDAMRAALSLTAVCAAIALVLGIFVLQRHRGARVALSIVAVPLLVTAPLVGGFLGAFVAVAALMLWNGPAGDWYAGRPIRQPAGQGGAGRPSGQGRSSLLSRPTPPNHPEAPPAAPPPASDPLDAPSTRETSTAPEATRGFGAATDPSAPPAVDAPAPSPYATSAWGQPTSADPAAAPVPTPVRVACLLTWTFSGSVALMYLAGVVALLVDRAAIVNRVVDTPAWRDAGVDKDLLVPLLWFGVLLFLAWSLGAVVLAWFTWRRHDWARYLLAVSAGLALLVGAIAFPVGILHQLACAATIGSLFSPGSRAWFSNRGRRPGPPSGPQSPAEGQLPPPPPRNSPW
jgi:hypothetical protein